METNIFVYWSDGLGDRAFYHHYRNGGRGVCQNAMKIARPSDQFFQMPGVGGDNTKVDCVVMKEVFSCKKSRRKTLSWNNSCLIEGGQEDVTRLKSFECAT